MNYAEKLLDPRWQKVRLLVFERDNWTCKKCKEITKTLHCHHLKYTTDDPWDEPLENLVTHCNGCHEKDHIDPIKNFIVLNELNNCYIERAKIYDIRWNKDSKLTPSEILIFENAYNDLTIEIEKLKEKLQ